MILTYQELKREWSRKKIRFDPDIDSKQIGLSSSDLRLGRLFTTLIDKAGVTVQPARGFDPTGLVKDHDLNNQMFWASLAHLN